MTDTITAPSCTDPACSHWVRVKGGLSAYLAGHVMEALPEGTMLVYDGPGVLPGMFNMHVPHDWYAKDPEEDPEEDPEDAEVGAVYPKASAPDAIAAVEARAGRWQHRYLLARERIDRLEHELETVRGY